MTTPRLILAPLADFTDSPFRIMALSSGADAAYTEMVSAAALAHSHNPTRILLATLPDEPPPACQIFSANESDVAHAAREISALSRFRELNLNAGCPMQKVTRSGAGAVLAKSPAAVHRLLTAMRENSPLPITLKTRLGPCPDAVTIFELIDAASSAGAKAVVVHARFTSQMHGGSPHLEILAEAVRRSSIPIIGNGSVIDASSAIAMAQTGVCGLMIGRAALAHPEIFSEIKSAFSGEQPLLPQATRERALTLFRRHLDLVIRFHSCLVQSLPGVRIPALDTFAALKVRTHLFRYFSGLPGSAALRARFNTIRTLSEINEIIA